MSAALKLAFPSASVKYELASSVKQSSIVMNMQMYTMLLDVISPNSYTSESDLHLQGNACDEEEDIENSPNCECG